MNHAGEIAALTRLVRPHVAIVTAIAPAHIENLGTEEAIADAKGEIFEGLEPGGIAIVPNDSPHRDRLIRAARRHADEILTFGSGDADVQRSMRSLVGGREPDHRGAARKRSDLHHLPARRALGVERARGHRGGRSAGRRPRRGRSRAGRARRAQGPRRAPPDPVGRRRGPAHRRELQRQSRLDGRDAQEPRREHDIDGASRCLAR